MTAARGASLPRPIFCPLPRVDGADPQMSLDGATSIALAYPGYARLPSMIPVFSVGAGRIVRRSTGAEPAVEIAHGNGWMSRYTGLAFAMVPREQPRRGRRIGAGDLLGYVRRERPHIRVEVRQQDLEPRDLLDQVAGWSVLPWVAEPPIGREPVDRTIRPRAARDLDAGA